MIGLYGGSFDPVHIGHLRIAEDIREAFSLERVIFIPAYQSPLKSKSRASAEDRFKMLKLSLKENPFFGIDDIEIKRKGKSYTIDTVLFYKEKLGYPPVFILGTDAFLSFHLWKSPEELIKNANFIVAGRDEISFYDVEEYVKDYFPEAVIRKDKKIEKGKSGNIYYFSMRRLDISSTEIRNRVKDGKSIKYLVLPEVERYIFYKKLYRG